MKRKIDSLVWEKVYEGRDKEDSWGFISIDIYAHRKNFNNNGDKFLINIKSDTEALMIPMGDLNDLTYDLEQYVSSEDIYFVVCGNWELSSLLKIKWLKK